MMDLLAYLWVHRQRPKSLRRLVVVWAKRLRQLPAVVQIAWRIAGLRRQGAKIGRLVNVGASAISGNLSMLTIGKQSALGRCVIAVHAPVTIGRCVVINDGAVLLTASHRVRDPEWQSYARPIELQDFVWVATNAVILPGVRIGRGAVVGAGAVVREDVEPYTVVVGNPAVKLPYERAAQLNYSPVALTAAFEAWVGRPVTSQTETS